ncbi:hypothetical protein GA707_03960 [Nostocoides sp. F2B08]|uniref:hypothetical protein n=1 Tax=Nostocoides sp. F2B08 TaxID=2653936 RepID=UPI0012637671|nr:hypothetical protein [Tetrasphaera sp. F2B08]KAB7745130.1 hypothetical protein GA707_03960 [Tetrasphaera sp. F2B08]
MPRGLGVGLGEPTCELIVDVSDPCEFDVVHPHIECRMSDLLDALRDKLVRQCDRQHSRYSAGDVLTRTPQEGKAQGLPVQGEPGRLRARGIAATIPEREDQIAHRAKAAK